MVLKTNGFLSTIKRQAEEAGVNSHPFDGKAALVLVISAVCLSCTYYLGSLKKATDIASSIGWNSLAEKLSELSAVSAFDQLIQLGYWVSILSVFYIVVPVLFIRLFFRESLAAYGLGFKNVFSNYKIYLVFLLFMLPLVALVSYLPAFQQKYPFYDVRPGESLLQGFWKWQVLYFIQFIGVEFFFRGFMVHGTKKALGIYAVFVMTIPYCMIHFGKPFPETIAAIFAGLILGWLSLKSRQVWLGVAIHYSVAITMDLLALWQKGLL